MPETLSATGLIANAAVEALIERVNSALNASASEPVLTYSDSNGISLTVAQAQAPKVIVEHLQSDAEGVSGRLFIEIPEEHPLSAELFGDFTVALTAFDLTLAKSAFVSTNITGSLQIPFFSNEDGSPETVDFEVAIRADGSLAVTLAAQQSEAEKMTADGLVKLHYALPAESSIDLSIATLELEREADGVWQLTLTGALALDTVGIDWPEVQLRGLSIDSKGDVKLQGGWIELPSHTAIDFFGFHVALERLGLGSEVNGNGETQRWIGFDGEVNLVEGVPLGGSVRGLQVNLATGAVSFNGVAVAFEIEDVLSFSGEIDHAQFETAEEAAAAGLPASFVEACEVKKGSPASVFFGGVDVTIEVAGNLEVDAQFIVAQVPLRGGGTQSCFFLALDAELPVGIPLFADVALYGLSGMFASNLRPDIGSATWWDWYKYPTAQSGLPDTSETTPDLQGGSGKPDFTATDVYKWLHPEAGAFALGAGAVIGTQDDGFTASASIAFVLILPGPVVMLIGQANVLSKRVGGPGEGADFEALAVYDGEAETFELVIEAQYSIPVLLDVQATAELHVDAKPGEELWFLAIGKPPHEQRVSARVLDLFETDLYFVVSQSGLVTGIWTGYRNSWSFGPLSASLDAYLAAMAAIQWSPLQLGAGVELHGEIKLEAFGIGLGITADALLEATAPDPWWVHGELSVELELPWPLPNVGGTVSLSWGGNGPPPPAPLALNSLSATLVDHGASDHYELLAHRAHAAVNAAPGADIVVYDPPPGEAKAPGILEASPGEYWVARYPGVASDPSSVVPNLDPGTLGEPTTLAWAPLVPQDSHFALHFAHPVADETGVFAGSVSPPPEVVEVKLPESPVIGKDDMSNIDLQPPAVQWCINHKLRQVALYRYEEGAGAKGGWELIAASQPAGYSVTAPLQLRGAWTAADPAAVPPTGVPVAGTVLKLAPYTVLDGEAFSVAWGGEARTLGLSFVEQELAFAAGAGIAAARIASPGRGAPTGVCFQAQENAAGTFTVAFPWKGALTALSGVVLLDGGSKYAPPQVRSGGQPLTPASIEQDPSTLIYTLTFAGAQAVGEIELEVEAGTATYVLSLAYTTPDIDMPILPSAPGLYALKTVTVIETGRVGANNEVPTYTPVQNGEPVIEFAYLQCASGPGTASIAPPGAPSPEEPSPSGAGAAIGAPPVPYRQPPSTPLAEAYLTLTEAQESSGGTPPPGGRPPSTFPQGGRLNDLATYTQWSWPGNGDAAAYYGYDLNVEFNETYVNALYATFLSSVAPYELANPPAKPALHMRCMDRNHRHTLLDPIATHVPSAYPQSALVSRVVELSLPEQIAQAAPVAPPRISPNAPVLRPTAPAVAPLLQPPLGQPAGVLSARSLDAARAMLVASPGSQLAKRVDSSALPALQAAIANAGLNLQAQAIGAAIAVDSGLMQALKHELQELAAAAQARELWFAPLAPQMRYTLDVVAGPLAIGGQRDTGAASLELPSYGSATGATLESILHAGDAIGTLAALEAYFARDDALSTLQRVQFTTSRYASFGDQVKNVRAPSTATVRRYPRPPAGGEVKTLLTATASEAGRAQASAAYLAARTALADMLHRFKPLYDVEQPAPPAPVSSGDGEQALAAQRGETEQAWQAFASATASTFGELVTALDQPALAEWASGPLPPETELSLLSEDDDTRVVALLLASPEPLPWRRMWQWTTLEPIGGYAGKPTEIAILWSADQTRALIVLLERPVGKYALRLGFEGNIGPEVACITSGGASVSETATCVPITIAPVRRRPVIVRPVEPTASPLHDGVA